LFVSLLRLGVSNGSYNCIIFGRLTRLAIERGAGK